MTKPREGALLKCLWFCLPDIWFMHHGLVFREADAQGVTIPRDDDTDGDFGLLADSNALRRLTSSSPRRFCFPNYNIESYDNTRKHGLNLPSEDCVLPPDGLEDDGHTGGG